MQALYSNQYFILVLIFVAAFGGALGLLHLFSPNRARGRIQQIGGQTVGADLAGGPDHAWVEKLATWAKPVSQLSLPKDGWENSQLRIRFMNAGWRQPWAPSLYFAVKTVLAILLPLAALLVLSSRPEHHDQEVVLAVLGLLSAIGYYLPNAALARKVEHRQRDVFEEFPDMLDLLTVCRSRARPGRCHDARVGRTRAALPRNG